MTSATTRLSRVSIAILIASGLAVPAAAGQADYFLKIEGVDGESKDAGHKEWIEIQSVDWGKPVSSRGGVRVAVGDVTGDGASAGDEHEVEYAVVAGKDEPKVGSVVSRKPSPAKPGSAGSVKAPEPKPQAIGLLLPAVQKARATVRGKYSECRVGDTRDRLVATATSGKRIVLKDVTITACNRASGEASGDAMPMETISLNFAKVE